MKQIDFNTWHRKEYYTFFSQYKDPYFGLVADIDCSKTFEYSKKNKTSFFASYLHKSLIAANQIPEFKYRIVDKNIILFDEVHAATTIGRKDGSFGFSFVQFKNDFDEFLKLLNSEILQVNKTKGIRYLEESERLDTVHYSSIPWTSFTGLKHPSGCKEDVSSPKIVFGKVKNNGDKYYLPVAVNAHHGLCDGIHIAEFLKLFESLMNE